MARPLPDRARASMRRRVARLWRERPHIAARVLPWTEHLHRCRARVRRRVPDRPLERVLHQYALATPAARFVQIGAHDGTQLDPLREAILASHWRGIMVEPVPYVFARLEARYRGNPRIALENVAVSDRDGHRPFHYLAEAAPGEPVWGWYDALGSFKRDVVLSHDAQVDDIDGRLVTEDLPCVTFDTLCTRNGFSGVEVVQIDTEGYDREVLAMIDLDRHGVEVVIYEHLHMSPADRAACRDQVAALGFDQVSDGMDTIAVSPVALEHPGVATELAAARRALAGFVQ